MNTSQPPTAPKVFRTQAWVQAWIDTWGKDKGIELIDLGGNANPLEYVYRTTYRLRGVVPVTTFCPAGIGYGAISTPRAEYNDINAILQSEDGANNLRKLLRASSWQQLVLPDIADQCVLEHCRQLSQDNGWPIYLAKSETSYSIENIDFTDYLNQLGPNTRLAYFHRRERLQKHGTVKLQSYPVTKAEVFFAILNQFHVTRWGKPCYSPSSQRFMKNFMQRLEESGGKIIMQALTVEGKAVSVLYDVIWGQTRYNFQSGYHEGLFPKISLGAVHFGYAIEAALTNGQEYDLLAGAGKYSNYKERVSNRQTEMHTLVLQTKLLSNARSIALTLGKANTFVKANLSQNTRKEHTQP